jgi:peroxiredoxin
MLEVGSKMPAFTLRDTDREEVTHESFAGEVTVLAFYPMAFTGG